MVDDLERVRIATDNRLRSLIQVYGLTMEHPDVAAVAALATQLADQERQAVRNLSRVMRAHPLGPVIGATVGVGFKQAARLLAVIGDPYWNDLHDRPRTVSELWAYCGYHVLHPGDQTATDTQFSGVAGVAPKHRKGEQANWNEKARMRTRLIAEQCIRHRSSPYRPLYDDARVKYADKGLTPGHEHNRALRMVAKELLKDLWCAARFIHEREEES
jgi:hypothetical protein